MRIGPVQLFGKPGEPLITVCSSLVDRPGSGVVDLPVVGGLTAPPPMSPGMRATVTRAVSVWGDMRPDDRPARQAVAPSFSCCRRSSASTYSSTIPSTTSLVRRTVLANPITWPAGLKFTSLASSG